MSLVDAIAETLAMGRMRDEPSKKDREDAARIEAGIQERRVAAGLKPLTGEEGRIVGSIEVNETEVEE